MRATRLSVANYNTTLSSNGRDAERMAEIARLTYAAAVRDVTAQTKTAYYQNQLDLALNDLITENVTNLEQVERDGRLQEVKARLVVCFTRLLSRCAAFICYRLITNRRLLINLFH
jgi:hypothetical protein